MGRGVAGREWAVVALVVVVTAGCNGLAGGATTTTETLTPAPVDTAESPAPAGETGDASLPPGVEADGAVSVDALLVAHEAAHAGESYTWVLSYNRTNLRTGLARSDYTKRVRVAAPDRYLVEQTSRKSDGVNRTVFVNESGEYTKFTFRNYTSLRYLPNVIDSDGVVDAESFVERALDVRESRVRRVERDGEAYYRVHALEPPSTLATRHRASSIRNFTATAYVTPAGFVRTLAVEYEFATRGGRVRVAVRFDYRALGETTVPKPNWTDDVRGPPAW